MGTLTERAEQDRRIRNKRKSFVRRFRANSSLSNKQAVSLKSKQFLNGRGQKWETRVVNNRRRGMPVWPEVWSVGTSKFFER